MSDFFERYDLLATPTTPVPAFPVRQPPPTINGFEVPHYASTTLLTILWNLTGQPAASLPCGFTENGLPVGLQLIGRHGDDLGVLLASRAVGKGETLAYGDPGLRPRLGYAACETGLLSSSSLAVRCCSSPSVRSRPLGP